MRYSDALFEAKHFIDAAMVGILFMLGFFHLTRLNHLVPNTYRGEYQLMAQKVADRNEDLNLKSDSVYENQIEAADQEFEDEEETSLVDKFFSMWDFLVQMNVFLIILLNVLYKFGICDYLAPGTSTYIFLKQMGLTKNISLISMFALSHVNQSKYIGISKVDSFQYIMIRVLPLILQFLIIIKSDYVGTLKYHFE